MTLQNPWLLGCPVPDSGKIAAGIYNGGPMLTDDRNGPTSFDTHMQIVSKVTQADFDAYMEKLKSCRITPYLERSLGDDRFFVFWQGEKDYHVRFAASQGQLRVTEGPQCDSLKDFGYSARGEKQTVVYQYGLYYDPDNNMTPTTANCGMLYIVRLSDNSLFMIDGGYYLQWNEEAAAALWQFLLKITQTPENGKIRIAGWYFTHTHADHIDGCVKLLNRHHHQIELERLLFNFPLYESVGGYEASAYHVRELAAKWYPGVKALKLHTGQEFNLADMKVEVYYTMEDPVTAEEPDRFPFRDGNCMSAILKLTIDGKTIMMLGDTNIETEAFLAKYSEPRLWKADMVQLAHHCFNYLDTLYAWIDAPVIMVPNSWGGAHQPENVAKLAGALKYMKDDQIYYEGGGTDGFAATEEGWKRIVHYDLVGGEYDGSGY